MNVWNVWLYDFSDVLLHALLHSQAVPPVLRGVALPHIEAMVVLLLFWRRILYWSTGKGMDKMEFTAAESDSTTLVGKNQQYKEPFLSTDEASVGEGESFCKSRAKILLF